MAGGFRSARVASSRSPSSSPSEVATRARGLLPALAALLALAGCATFEAHDGAPAGQLAIVQGDPRFNAGLPLVVTLRMVGEREVGARYARAAVPAGTHRLLVDCTLTETRSTTRHELEVELVAGGRYVLVGEAAPGNQRCGAVRLEAR